MNSMMLGVCVPLFLQAVQCLIELLEHSDQKVRIGACNALAKLKVCKIQLPRHLKTFRRTNYEIRPSLQANYGL